MSKPRKLPSFNDLAKIFFPISEYAWVTDESVDFGFGYFKNDHIAWNILNYTQNMYTFQLYVEFTHYIPFSQCMVSDDINGHTPGIFLTMTASGENDLSFNFTGFVKPSETYVIVASYMGNIIPIYLYPNVFDDVSSWRFRIDVNARINKTLFDEYGTCDTSYLICHSVFVYTI